MWATIWFAAVLLPAPWDGAVALAVFAAACLDTIVHGAATRDESLGSIFTTSALGVSTLGMVSWTPILAVGLVALVGFAQGGFLVVVLLFGMPISMAVAAVGYLLLLILLGVGRLLAVLWSRSRHRVALRLEEPGRPSPKH
jgi:hypothetical protein